MLHHRARFRIDILSAVLTATFMMAQPGATFSDSSMQLNREAAIEPLVNVEWLAAHLDDPDIVVLDCTVSFGRSETGGIEIASGRAAYQNGHIPSAGFADLVKDLAGPESSLRFSMPSPERFAAAMSALGIGDDSRVVLYDSNGSVWAARVWWMLRWIGFDRAAILDGGLAAWTASDRPLSTEPAEGSPGKLSVNLRRRLIADRDEVLAAIDDDQVVIVDVLPEAHYRGDMAMYARPGHIPTALNIPVQLLVDVTGHFRSLDDVAALHTTDRSARHITYCGGGIAASAAAFVMTRLGYGDVAVYAASLQEWAADPANPMEVGVPPTAARQQPEE